MGASRENGDQPVSLYPVAELVGFDKAQRIWADGTIENQLDKALVDILRILLPASRLISLAFRLG